MPGICEQPADPVENFKIPPSLNHSAVPTFERNKFRMYVKFLLRLQCRKQFIFTGQVVCLTHSVGSPFYFRENPLDVINDRSRF